MLSGFGAMGFPSSIKWLKLLDLSADFIGEHIWTAVCRSLAVIVKAPSWSTVEKHLQSDVRSRNRLLYLYTASRLL